MFFHGCTSVSGAEKNLSIILLGGFSYMYYCNRRFLRLHMISDYCSLYDFYTLRNRQKLPVVKEFYLKLLHVCVCFNDIFVTYNVPRS